MSLASTTVNAVKIYNLGAGKTMPQWLSEKTKEKLRKDTEYQKHVELIQDFEFPATSQRIKETPNGKFVIATGVYPPQIRCYEYSQLSMKWKRHLDCEVVQFQILSDDWTKLVFLEADRHVEFHTQGGTYYKTRIPKFGRDMVYHPSSCVLVIVASGKEVYRLNLEQGRFVAPFEAATEGFNSCDVSPVHGLLAIGGEAGVMECWDPRQHRCAGSVVVGTEITSVRFQPSDPLSLAAGTSGGHVCLYDLRMSVPLRVKDHQNGEPIVHLDFLHAAESNLIVSSDTNVVKIWHADSGRPFTSIERGSRIADVCLPAESGLIFTAGESERIGTYFVPQLGVAPRWCSFLENLTEELEDEPATVYDDFKFVTREELEQIGLSHLIGTAMLHAFMHGFFVDMRLYNRAKAITEPFGYESYRKNLVQQKIEEARENRISLKRRVPKPRVNKELVERLTAEEDSEPKAPALLTDDRFAALFSNPDFQIDEEHEDFKRIYSSGVKGKSNGSSEENRTRAIKSELYQLKKGGEYRWDNANGSRGASSQSLGRQTDMLNADDHIVKPSLSAGRVMTFVPQSVRSRRPQSARAKSEIEHRKETRTRKRRGIRELGLASEKHSKRGAR